MAKKGNFIPNALRPWIEARGRFKLTHAQVQMARELGLNLGKLGSLANHRQESWKAPLPMYIERLYAKRFGKRAPEGWRAGRAGGRDMRSRRRNPGYCDRQAPGP